MKHTTKLTLSTIVAIFSLLVSLALPAMAYGASGQAYSISPPLLELQGNPGQQLIAKVKITNVSADTLTMQAQANDFGAKDETGDPNIIFDTTQSTPYSLRNWITLPNNFPLASKESRTIDFPVTIPKNAEPGGHYAVIRFTGTAAGAEPGSVALNASIGSLVLLQVSGKTEQKANIASFYSADSAFEQRGFFEQAPLQLVERIQNTGNIHLKPTGTITVKDMLGRTSATLNMNGKLGDNSDPPKAILPQSIRRFSQEMDNSWMFGRYTATLAATYGDSNQKLSATTTFWVIPYKLIILGLAVVALIVGGTVWLRKRQLRARVWHNK